MEQLKYYKIHDDVLDPKFGTASSACFDICAYIKTGDPVVVYAPNNKKVNIRVKDYKLEIKSGDRVLVPTGLIFDIPEDHSLRLHVRSSVALKQGLFLANSEGIVDEDYYHETFIMLANNSSNTVYVQDSDRIAQAELVPVHSYELNRTLSIPKQKTDRIGGFGSTGI